MLTRILSTVLLAVAPAAFAQTYLVPQGECGNVTLHVTGATPTSDVTRAYAFLPKQRVELKPAAGSRDYAIQVPDTNVVMAAIDFAPVINGSETDTEHAKAFIRCGAIAKSDDWQRTTGIGLEIYPQWNGLMPLKPGDTMHFIVVDRTASKDNLLRDVPMDLYLTGAGLVASGKPNSNGHVTFPYKEPGRYTVVAKYRRPDPNNASQQLVDTSTLTFEMK